MDKIIKIKKKLSRGFTLVETLVAISIFTVSILSLMAVVSQSITNTNYAKKKIIASYLAQEGVEYMRNLRDTFVLYSPTSQEGWDDFDDMLTSESCFASNGCYFDDQNLNYGDTSMPIVDITLDGCSSSCPTLFYNETTGKYGYTGGVDSEYIRKIKVTTVSANELKVSSTVYWKQGSGTYNMAFTENLFNWVE